MNLPQNILYTWTNTFFLFQFFVFLLQYVTSLQNVSVHQKKIKTLRLRGLNWSIESQSVFKSPTAGYMAMYSGILM